MIGKIRKRFHMDRLVSYLVGPGRHNEHSNPRVIAGSEMAVAGWGNVVGAQAWDKLEVDTLAAHLDGPATGHRFLARHENQVEGLAVTDEPDWGSAEPEAILDAAPQAQRTKARPDVVHIALTLDPKDRHLSDAEWERFCTRYLAKMGWADTRWAAVHHGHNEAGADHVHIAMSAIREDGSWIDQNRDFVRNKQVCRELEREFGLRSLADPGATRGMPGLSPGELRRTPTDATKGVRQTREQVVAQVRDLASIARDEAEFVELMRSNKVGFFAQRAWDGSHVAAFKLRVGQHADGTGRWQASGSLDPELDLAALRRKWGEQQPDMSVWTVKRHAPKNVYDGPQRVRPEAASSARAHVERLVRVSALQARTEAGFVAALRANGVRVYPRWDAGKTTVVGYRVLLERDTNGRPIWCGGGKLARDLSLAQLREQWGSDPTDPATREAWANAHRKPADTGSRTSGGAPETLKRIHDMKRDWDRHGIDRRHAAGDVAALLGAASESFGHRGYTGPGTKLAAAARRAARAAQPDLDVIPSRQPTSKDNPARAAALMLKAIGKNDLAGWLAVLDQLSRTLKAVEEMHIMAGEAAAAQNLARAYSENVREAITDIRTAQGIAGRTVAHAPIPATRLITGARPDLTPESGQRPERRPRPEPGPQPGRAHT